MRRVLGVVIGACTLAAPSTAIAATVGPDASGRIVFKAAAGEANRGSGDGHPGAGGGVTFRDLGAPVAVRPPCVAGTVVTSPFNPSFLLRDGDDVGWYLSNLGNTSIDGGAGNDDLLTGASLDAHADGGPGDDIVFVSA